MDDNEIGFKIWMQGIDEWFTRYIGVTTNDLPDKTYRDWFDSGMSVTEAIRQILEDEEIPHPGPVSEDFE